MPGTGDRRARQATEPLREMAALALLGGNAVFLLIAFLSLFFTFDSWAVGFGMRSEATFDDFAGLMAIGFPLLAVLLATHLGPLSPRARVITMVALIEYPASGFLGLVTFIGRFANRLDSDPFLGGSGLRRAFEGLFAGMVWLGLLAFAAYAVYRVWMHVFYVPKPRYGYPQTYGQPYPGQPSYPQPGYGQHTYQTGYAQPAYPSPYERSAGLPVYGGSPVAMGSPASSPVAPGSPVASDLPVAPGSPVVPASAAPSPLSYPTSGAGGWPAVPPPPMPAPPLAPGSPVQPGPSVQPGPPFPPAEPTQRLPSYPQPVTPARPPANDNEPTRRIPAVPSPSPSLSSTSSPAVSPNGPAAAANGSAGDGHPPPQPSSSPPADPPHDPPTQQLHP